MTPKEFDPLLQGARMLERGEAFALATVIGRKAPSSARVGDRALIEADGTLRGWIGGSCIEDVVRREAVNALRERRPRIVVLSPDATSDRDDAVVHPMTCHSGGTVEVYVEPEIPRPVVEVYGESPVSHALGAMAEAAGFRVRRFGEPGKVPERTGAGDGAGARDAFAVIATMGSWDDIAVERALSGPARYVGLVASPKRAGEVRRRVGERLPEERIADLRSPAGLDLGAKEPGEIAVTILAEIVAERRRARTTVEGGDDGADATRDVSAEASGAEMRERDRVSAETGGASKPAKSVSAETSAIDPVCGMSVDPERSPHTFDHRGTLYHFCCAGCRERFADDPERFIT